MMRALTALLVMIMSLTLGSPAQAQSYDTPKALVEAIYQPYQNRQRHIDLSIFYSQGLKTLFAQRADQERADGQATPQSDLGILEFNPFVEGDNYLLFDLVISEPLVIGDTAIVAVSFHNFDHPSLLSLSLRREAGGWKVDDVASMGGEEHWLLSWLLSNDPYVL